MTVIFDKGCSKKEYNFKAFKTLYGDVDNAAKVCAQQNSKSPWCIEVFYCLGEEEKKYHAAQVDISDVFDTDERGFCPKLARKFEEECVDKYKDKDIFDNKPICDGVEDLVLYINKALEMDQDNTLAIVMNFEDCLDKDKKIQGLIAIMDMVISAEYSTQKEKHTRAYEAIDKAISALGENL